jgi:hypothetical protein
MLIALVLEFANSILLTEGLLLICLALEFANSINAAAHLVSSYLYCGAALL